MRLLAFVFVIVFRFSVISTNLFAATYLWFISHFQLFFFVNIIKPFRYVFFRLSFLFLCAHFRKMRIERLTEWLPNCCGWNSFGSLIGGLELRWFWQLYYLCDYLSCCLLPLFFKDRVDNSVISHVDRSLSCWFNVVFGLFLCIQILLQYSCRG